MKLIRIAFGILALAMSVNFATAADVWHKPTVRGTVTQSTTVNWQGVYIGGNFGAGIGDNSVTNSQTNTGPLAAFFGSIPGGDSQSRQRGWVYGLQGGVNFQNGPVVFGIETEFDWSTIKARSQANQTLPLIGQASSGSTYSELEWLWLTQARLGLAMGRFLPYVGGGLAVGKVNTTGATAGNLGPIAFGNGSFDSGPTKTGWTVGGGLEAMLDRNWSAKIQYNYVDLGSDSGAYRGTCFGTTCPSFAWNSEFNYHILKFGVNYKFGG